MREGCAGELAGGLARNERGVALIEFTMVFPLLIVLFLGLVEFSQALAVQRKVSNAAATIADLIAQMPKVTVADLNNIAKVAETLLQPYSAQELALVVTSVEADTDNRRTIVGWSFARGSGAAARPKGASYGLPRGLTEASSSVIMTEASYSFRPTMAYFLTGTIRLTGIGYFRPRASRVVVKLD